MHVKRQVKKPAKSAVEDADALFVGLGERAIARKTLPPGYTVADLQQFVTLLYDMYDEREAKVVTVFDPFAQEKGRRITVARLTDALESLIERYQQRCM